VKNYSAGLGSRRRVGQVELHHDLGSKKFVNGNDDLVNRAARPFLVGHEVPVEYGVDLNLVRENCGAVGASPP